MITGAIKVQDFPDMENLTTVKKLLQDLEKYLLVEMPVSAITNVFVSFEEPNVTSRDIVWFRLDASGNYVGQFIYVSGQWVQMHPPPNEVIKMYGRSDQVPVGYALINNDTPGFTSGMVTKLMEEWHEHPIDEDVYVIFHVVYTGL
jgi:hypothetical protein